MTFDEKIRIGAAVADAAEKAQEEQLKKIEELGNELSLPKSLQVKYDYSYVSDFEYGLARVRQGKLWGLINKNGEVVLPIQYDEIWKFEGKHRATTNVVFQGKKSEIRLCDYSDEAPMPYWEMPRPPRRTRYDLCEDYEDSYYSDDYISPLDAFEGDEDLYNEWLLNS
jgi:hypothetical protein